MKLGIVSDVHCQDEHLARTIQALIAEGVDEILCAGDAHYEYRLSNEVAELLQEHDVRYIQGNHEWVLMGPHGAGARSAPHVRQANIEHIDQAPEQIRTTVNGKSLLMIHASPWAPKGHYLHAGDPLFERCDELDADYLIIGHTHVPMVKRFGRTLVINPGSLSFSREAGQYGMLSYAILDTTTDEVHMQHPPKDSPTQLAVDGSVAPATT
ncbi:MAG: metallophosphoesterase family protein [Candidatus Nanopelagicales bacterium]|nr:metallophosphoesterase family protein [Candidatus Nanopelagicales bacterium]